MRQPAAGAPTTVGDAVTLVAEAVRSAGVGETPRLDAELLVGHVTRLDRVALRTRSEEALAPRAWLQLDALVRRRSAGEPIAYLLGSQWFWGREFTVDARVLVPRPETELLVECVLRHADGRTGPLTIVDACTGSGCIAITLAAELEGRATLHATDISRDALDVARGNAERHDVKVDWHLGSLLEPVAALIGVGVVVANPPYVDGVDDVGLAPCVRDFEPHEALFVQKGDVVGLYRELARQAARTLDPGGLLAVEHGAGQRSMVVQALAEAGFEHVAAFEDLAGIDRVVQGLRAG